MTLGTDSVFSPFFVAQAPCAAYVAQHAAASLSDEMSTIASVTTITCCLPQPR